jgi:hypothetical protein
MAETMKEQMKVEDFLDASIAEIKDELNELAMWGAMPLWSTLIVRLDRLSEDLKEFTARKSGGG